MYALHLVVNAIHAGDCDSAIVASANWIADPGVQIALDKLGALSASSRRHTFDARAEGYARGEGYGAIYLKRPSLAIADKSPTRAMIRGTAINSNGRTGGITRPSASGQEVVVREDYRNARDPPLSDTTYFECHGTGTYVGDPIEVAAVGRAFAPERFAEDPLLVGFIKSNVAYTFGARRSSRLAQRSLRIVDKDNVAQGLEVDRKPVRAPLQTSNLGFIFTGQGAQRHAVGAELFEYRVFRTAIEYLDYVLGSLPNTPSWSLYDILSGDCDAALIRTAEVSQAACTGLVDLLASWSIRPSGVAGHSSGEMAAAYASGCTTAAKAIVAAYLRGQAMSKNKRKGAMLAVGLGPDQVAKYLGGREDEVKLAAINSPGSVTPSGEVAAIGRGRSHRPAFRSHDRRPRLQSNAEDRRQCLPFASHDLSRPRIHRYAHQGNQTHP